MSLLRSRVELRCRLLLFRAGDHLKGVGFKHIFVISQFEVSLLEIKHFVSGVVSVNLSFCNVMRNKVFHCNGLELKWHASAVSTEVEQELGLP
jgi:hypothetical protein